MKGHLLVLGYDDRDVLKEDIRQALQPHYEWLGAWKPCFASVILRIHRGQGKLWLSPMLWSVCGAPVPYCVPVQLAQPSDSLMAFIAQHYRMNYRQAPVSDRLAAFADKMLGDEHPKRRKKGGAK